MKKMVAIALTVTLLVIAGFFAFISFPTVGPDALADGPEVTVSPQYGPTGTNVTVEGTGFNPGDDNGWALIMYYDVVAGGSVTGSWIEVDDQGSFSMQGQIPVGVSPGVHAVVVFFNPDDPGVFNPANPNQVWAQELFTVTQRELTMVPDEVPFGKVVTLSGGGFGSDAHGEIPQLWINDQRVYLDDIDDQELSSGGNIVPVVFEISADMNFHYGENLVEIRAPVNGATQSAGTTCDVARPTLEIEPTQGPRGTKVTATGSGWLTGMTDFVTLSYDRADTPENEDVAVAIVRANEYGDIWTQFTIPPLWMGEESFELVIRADDAKGNSSLETTFTIISPCISVEPEAAWPGEAVVVSGTGFQPKTQIQEVSIGDAPIIPVYELGLTNAQGQFAVYGIVPGVMPGTRLVKVRVVEGEDNPVTTKFTVLGDYEPGTPSGPPQIFVEPDEGHSGGAVMVRGINFLPLCCVQEVSIGNAPIVPVYELPLTSGTGSFKVDGIVPGLMAGNYVVRARVTQAQDAPVTYPFTVLPGDPDDPTVELGLASIDGHYTTLWTFNAALQEWQVYQPDLPPWVPVFSRLNPGQGYWIAVTEDCTLTYGANTWNLKTTWNLIGWLG